MIDYKIELEEMVSKKNLMNSYKLYFLKAILINVSPIRKTFTFNQMACWMVAYSFEDVCHLQKRIRPLDKLFDIAVLAIEEEDLMESSSVAKVCMILEKTTNPKICKELRSLCNYVPYRLLAYRWQNELKGRTDKEKNLLLEQLSQSDDRNMYSIFSISKSLKEIEVREKWINYIIDNRESLLIWIDQKIKNFVWGE
ncbi:hypothetical protein [Blautia wexlerae]|uniref:hypothetical protein n=2 Tax=Blautia wexlerae TaxID=418240 RepID=UPI00325A765F